MSESELFVKKLYEIAKFENFKIGDLEITITKEERTEKEV